MTRVLNILDERLRRKGYLSEFLDRKKLDEIIQKNGTWFGQLMSTPQLVAWLIQLDFFMEYYKVDLVD